ncbi:MAG: cell wall protein [Myxococcaceae bacterium]
MIRHEVEVQLRPVREAMVRLQQQTASLSAVEDLASQLAPLTSLLSNLVGEPARPARRGRPPGVKAGKGQRGAPGENGRPCAVIGCPRSARTKGYCSAHYQKLRMLTRTNRRPPEWVDFAPPKSVKDVVLPRGRAASKALKASKAAKAAKEK